MFSPCVVGCAATRKSTCAAGEHERDAAVLRRARLGDVHAAHHLQAHHHRRPVVLVQAADLAQHAVDAVADAQEALLRLEVDVGGAALHRVVEQRVDQPHHRLAVFVELGGEALVVDLAGLDLVQDAVDRELVAVVVLDRDGDLGVAREAQLDAAGPRAAARGSGRAATMLFGSDEREDERALLVVVARPGTRGGAARGPWAPARCAAGSTTMCARSIALQPELLGEGVAQRGLGDEAELHQHLAQRLPWTSSARAARCAAGPR